MTKKSLAALLNGREYGSEITKEEAAEAKASGLLVIFGYSDDNVELRGRFEDEISCYEGGEIFLHRDGVLNLDESGDCERCQERMKQKAKKCVSVEMLWCKEEGYSWTYKTSVPHATFEIVEDGEKFCRGIVLEAGVLPKL